METGEKLREELTIPTMPLTADNTEISTVARHAALARLRESKAEDGLQTALHYRLLTEWTNWIAVVERPEGEKAVDIPALRKISQIQPACLMDMCLQSIQIPPIACVPLRRSMGLDSELSESFSRIMQRQQIERDPADALAYLSICGLSNIIAFLALIPESEWHAIFDWAVKEGHSDIAEETNEFQYLLRAQGVTNLSEEQARHGLMVLARATDFGFQIGKELLDEARRRGILSRSRI
jgi:hypothetical protein